MDIFKRIQENPGPLGQYSDFADGYFIFPELEGPIGPRMKFRGKEVITWSVNNYLGLANHPEVRKVDEEASKEWGLAYAMGARAMTGETKFHKKLESDLAEFVGKESAYILNFGYQGIMSAIDSLLSRNDVAVYDMDCHACIVDGLRMHLGKRFRYEHNDIEHLDRTLARATNLAEKSGGGILVITEGVFGMQGDQGKLKEIVALKEKYNFRLLVDDAHGFGTLGKTGAGAGEEQGVQDEIDIYFSTFAKSMASIGAFLAGDKEIIKYLRFNMRSQIFAKSLPLPIVIGNIKRLELLRTKPELKEKLWENARLLQGGLKERGFNLGKSNSCVSPVMLNCSLEESVNLVLDLRENHKIFCSVVIYPVVPKGMMLLRLIPTTVHTKEDILTTLDAFDKVRKTLVNGGYKKEIA